MKQLCAATHESGSVKGFGCRPLEGRRRVFGGRRPKASKGGNRAEQEVPVERHGYMTNLLGDRAVQTVEGYAKSKEPFLLSLHSPRRNWPWEGPDDEAES